MLEWKTILACIAIGVFAVAGLFAQTYFRTNPATSQITLVNRTSETISEAKMRQEGIELALGSIEPGGTRSVDFISREGPVTVVVKFKSGHAIWADKVGYLAAGLPVIVVFDVLSETVALRAVTKRGGRRSFP